jgi:hypothetical protein
MLPIIAYFSPETLLPATSIIATALGFIMLVGRGSFRLLVHGWRLAKNRTGRGAAIPAPHYANVDQFDRGDAYSYTTSPSASVTE